MTSSRPAALIVEDQPFIGLVASDILRESGFETFHAYDANDAVELLGAHPEIEVVVAGTDLPGEMSGLELCRRVSERRPDVQLVLTAAGEDLSRPTCQTARAFCTSLMRAASSGPWSPPSRFSPTPDPSRTGVWVKSSGCPVIQRVAGVL